MKLAWPPVKPRRRFSVLAAALSDAAENRANLPRLAGEVGPLETIGFCPQSSVQFYAALHGFISSHPS